LGRVLASAERLAKVLKPEKAKPEAAPKPSTPLAELGGWPYRVR
jgi:hypothetical protein